MIPDSWQERLGAFLRSVIPADPAQLLFLAGIVCLVFAPHMSRWPPQLNAFLARLKVPAEQERIDSLPFIIFPTWAIIFSALAGFFLCFWPGPHVVRRVIFFIFLPVLAAICTIFGRFAYLERTYSSALDKSTFHSLILFARSTAWTSTPGFHLAFAGLFLIGIFTSRMIFGIASLPLALPETSIVGLSDPQFWRRVQFLIWMVMGPILISVLPVGAIGGISLYFFSYGGISAQSPLFATLGTLAALLFSLLIVCWITGKTGRTIFRSSIRLPGPKYIFIASSFSIGIAGLISAGQYLFDRSHWTVTKFGNTPPRVGPYFNFLDTWLFIVFFGVFFEEIVFRGLLQTAFVRRYGLYPGIFLTGVVWAAFHFNSDAFSHPTELGVLSQLGFRMTMCLALGFVLSWLTLRSTSVLPAAITHTLYNVLVSHFGPYFPGKAMVWVGLWAILACFLFRYWPVQRPNDLAGEMSAAVPGAAV